MKHASKEDFIAKQYSNNYQDIFFSQSLDFLMKIRNFDKNNLKLIKVTIFRLSTGNFFILVAFRGRYTYQEKIWSKSRL